MRCKLPTSSESLKARPSSPLLLHHPPCVCIQLPLLLSSMGYGVPGPSPLHMDNQSAIWVSKNSEHHSHIKHLDLVHYWLRDKVSKVGLQGSYSLVPHWNSDWVNSTANTLCIYLCCQCCQKTGTMLVGSTFNRWTVQVQYHYIGYIYIGQSCSCFRCKQQLDDFGHPEDLDINIDSELKHHHIYLTYE